MTTVDAPVGRRTAMAARVARDLEDGWCVNVGIGMPLLLPGTPTPGREILYHCEHGLVGVGRPAEPDEVDLDVTDAAKGYVTLADGAASFDSSTSFAIARGGRLDLTVLGGLQVSRTGDLANWVVPGGDPGVGGAMDLAVGARRVWVMMNLLSKRGEPKLVDKCSYPLTAKGVVDRLYGDLAIFEFVDGSTVLREYADGADADQVAAATAVHYEVDLWPTVRTEGVERGDFDE